MRAGSRFQSAASTIAADLGGEVLGTEAAVLMATEAGNWLHGRGDILMSTETVDPITGVVRPGLAFYDKKYVSKLPDSKDFASKYPEYVMQEYFYQYALRQMNSLLSG